MQRPAGRAMPTATSAGAAPGHRSCHEDLSDEIQPNTAISELMKLSNAISSTGIDAISDPVCGGSVGSGWLLAPFAPHLRGVLELSGGIRQRASAELASLDPPPPVQDSVEVVIQVKGRCGQTAVPASASKEELDGSLASDVATK